MYDRLNSSNNSNDGRITQHIQERHYKRKWSEELSQERHKKKMNNQKNLLDRPPLSIMRRTKLVRTVCGPPTLAECTNCKR